ncbi:MAG: site-specific integrase [Gammaproteobacteria bacterium]|nr:site-specific integrase [Gammaproteobacteria bacterium]
MISGLVLKYLNGECFVIRRGYETTLPVSSSFCLTVPFTVFLGRSPDTAVPDDLRAYQLHMADTGVTPSTFNARTVALRFFFSMTCDRDEMKKYMQFRTEPRKLPIVLSVEEVSALLAAAPGPGLKYRAALSIGYGGELRASEVTHLKVRDIDSDRMLIHVERGKGGKDRDVMLSPSFDP